MFTGNKDKPLMLVVNTKPGFVFVFSEYIKDPTTLTLGRYFWFNSVSKKTSLGFCTCSELLQLKFDKKT